MSGRALRWLLSLLRRPAARGDAGGSRLTIIRHHRVYADDARPLYRLGVAERVFVAQLALLEREGLLPLTAADGLARLRQGHPGHWVALTFDDGYADNVTRALPALRAVGARATFYLTAGLIEERRAPWWDELAAALEQTRETQLSASVAGRALELPLRTVPERRAALHVLLGALRLAPPERERELALLRMRLGVPHHAECPLVSWGQAEALTGSGMEVGAHTLSHPHLTTLDPHAQAREIGGSVELIQRRLGVRPTGFAYPGGDYDAATLDVVRELGFDYAVTTRAGDNVPGASAYELVRRGLTEGACLGPSGRLSRRLTLAELSGAFDGLRDTREAAS